MLWQTQTSVHKYCITAELILRVIKMLTGSKLIIATLITLSATSWHPGGGEFKCYEDYRCITDTSSPQYELQQEAWTDEEGLRRVDDYYCVALGSAYGSDIGTKYIVTMSTGQTLPVILADQKADRDTVQGHTRDRNGAVIEFLVESETLPEAVRHAGDVSAIPGFEGNVKEIRRLNK